ncbi:hypothetical protein ACQP2X_13775 [Actinoplanes sp. CA-131856]
MRKRTFHRALSACAVAGALALTAGAIGAAAAALNAKPLRAELAPTAPADQIQAKPLRAE